MARRISTDKLLHLRLRGFLAAGVRNEAFCSAVCARLLPIMNEGDLRRSGATQREAGILLESTKLWVLKGGSDRRAEEGECSAESDVAAARRVSRELSGRTSEEALACIAAAELEQIGPVDRCVVGAGALINIGDIASPLLEKHVCAICLIQSLNSVAGHNVAVEEGVDKSFAEQVLLLKAGGKGALEALSRAHNKEMHALNGNISYISKGNAPVQDVMADTLARSDRAVKHIHVKYIDPNVMQDTAADEVPKLNYAVNVCQGTTLLAPPPTRHQYV